MKYIYILQQALGWIIVIYWLYQLIISACALIQFKEKPLIKNKKHKLQNHTNINNDNLLKTISDLINKANNVTITKTITIQTPPKEIKL